MLDPSKTLPMRRRDNLAGFSIAVHLDKAVEGPDVATSTADSPLHRWFAHGLARLIACDRCYVAILSPHGERIDEVKTGCPIADPVPEATVRAIASQLGAQGGLIFQSIASGNGFARRLKGKYAVPTLRDRPGTVALGLRGALRRGVATDVAFRSGVRQRDARDRFDVERRR